MNYQKPAKLKVGDTIGIVSPSWAGPNRFPAVFANGLKILTGWGLKIKEFPTARASHKELSSNPQMRAKDINAAFADKAVNGIIASIGGDDSIRVLPYLDREVISANPKILMGYSDNTTLTTYLDSLGIVSFNGPTIMAGFSQMKNLPPGFEAHVHKMLFDGGDHCEYKPYYTFSDGYPNWEIKGNLGKVKTPVNDGGWRFIQGRGIAEGKLWGGCIEVCEFLKGTRYWPNEKFWKNRILFFETSEEKPSVSAIQRMLRNYGVQGAFHKVSAILFGRAMKYSKQEKLDLDMGILNIIAGEFGARKLPIVTNMDFGHTDPQFVMPLGVNARVNCKKESFELTESWTR